MNHLELRRRFETLSPSLHLPPATLERFADVVAGLGDWDACRVNPLAFAKRYSFEGGEAIDLFVAATKAGIFDVEWNHVCPACGVIQVSRESLDRLECTVMRCELCAIDVPVSLDDEVEVTFALNPSVKKLLVDPFASPYHYQRYFFSGSYQRSPQVISYLEDAVMQFVALPPGRTRNLEVQLEPDSHYRLISLDSHTVVELKTQTGGEHAIEVELLPEGLNEKERTVAPGAVMLHFHNGQDRKSAFTLFRIDVERLRPLWEQYPTVRLPFLSAKMLLNSQVFRDLFRVQTIDPSLHLQLRSLTLLFTDLKGSTALYDRVGDLEAYRLIQDHFRALGRVVRRHSGAIIKTMGDAIMAAFSTPLDAVRSAVDMLAAMEELNASVGEQDVLGLKIGLHEGPAVAINADQRVDYFGQTVNIAARVQALADAGEIVLTDTLYRSVGVEECLAGIDARKTEMQAELKGVSQQTTVFRYALKPAPVLR